MMNFSLSRRARRALGLAAMAASGLLLSADGASQTHSSIHPYLQIEQVLTADFNGGDVLTYTGVGGGVTADISTRRVQATIAYDYQRRIAWNDRLADQDVHTGLAAVHVDAVPGLLTLDAGAIAARGHNDISRPVPGLRTTDNPNTAEIYAVYGGPSLSTHAGPVAVNASYRLGYVYVDDHSLAGGPVPAGTPRLDTYHSTTVQNAQASVGMAPGELPIGWTLAAGWGREDSDRLDSKFDGKFARGDVVLPVSATLAVTGGVGWEEMKASQQDFLRDPVTGAPVLNAGGRLVADPSAPRLLTYDQSGLIWDVGVIWRPSPRTELQLRGGRRYGGTTVVGTLEHRIHEDYVLTASIYDSVSSFGRLMIADLSGVPANFRTPRGGISGIGGLNGCIFAADPKQGGGACFDDALQSINNFNFRNRGANIGFSGGRGPWSFGLGATYANRRYFAPPGPTFVLHGVTDQSFVLNGTIGRRFTRSSGLDFDAYAGWYDSGVQGAPGAFSTGVSANYYRPIWRERLQANVAAGVYTTHSGQFDSTIGSILFGLRYTF
jgi:hypothetical protein